MTIKGDQKKAMNAKIHIWIDIILIHLKQFKGYPYLQDLNDDCGNYYDNFIDGRGF